VSYGGLIAQYIAAEHPATAERVVLALAAATITPWARDVDRRMAVARAEGRMDDAALAMSEYLFPNPGQSRQRRLVAPLMRGMFTDEQVPSGDLLVEADAEVAFDARAVLPQIGLPVLVLSAQEDLFFPREVVQETVDLIPDCTWIEYEGIGHLRAVGSGRLAEDIAAFAQ
jgi:pimeloyl-ACP methyl ester carboxylesterase